MARPAEDPALVRLPKGREYVYNAVEGGFDVTVRGICRALKCSRGFVDEHVREHVPHIYVGPRIGRELAFANITSDQGSTLYDRRSLDAMVAAGRVTRRTRLVWVTDAIEPESLGEAIGILVRVSRLEGAGQDEAYEAYKLLGKLEDLVLDHALPGWRPALESARWDTSRARASWVDAGDEAPSTLSKLRGWGTPASMRSWGDTDESVQRMIWRRAMARLEIALPDGTRRVLYGPEPDPAPVPERLAAILEEHPSIAEHVRWAVAVQELPRA